MTCKNCGGNYRTRELICPYCRTENVLGHLWLAKRKEAEEEYNRTAHTLREKLLSPYVFHRIIWSIWNTQKKENS